MTAKLFIQTQKQNTVKTATTRATKNPNKSFQFEKLSKDIWNKRQASGSNGAAIDVRTAADQAGMNYLTLYRMEAGMESPKLENLVSVCNWLGKPLQYYF